MSGETVRKGVLPGIVIGAKAEQRAGYADKRDQYIQEAERVQREQREATRIRALALILGAVCDEWERASVIAERIGKTGDRVGSQLATLVRHGKVEVRLNHETDCGEYRLAREATRERMGR